MISELTIVIPTFNEKENIKPLIERLEDVLAGHSWEVIFVDDDSGDGTAEYVRKLARVNPRIRCIQRLKRHGLSSACMEGILASSSPCILIMDADLQHDEKIIPDMLTTLGDEQVELVIGSRYLEGGSTGTLSSRRVWISRMATRVSRVILRSEISDPMSGFFMFKRGYFEGLMRKLSGKGFKILLDMLVSAEGKSKFVEIPYVMRSRMHGESKLGTQVVWEFFLLILDKALGKLLPLRFISFTAVGLSGVFVHLLVLWLLHKVWFTGFVPAQAVATFVAMTSNYVLNNELTYRDKKLRGKQFVSGLISFYVACSFGAIINVAIAGFIFEWSFPWWLAGFAGAVAGAVWNFAVTATFTWGETGRNKGQ